MTDPDIEELKRQHTREAIRRAFSEGSTRSYLRDAVYAASDGIVTTFAIVAGSQGAGFSSGVAMVLGIANVVADGFSMASGNFLGSRAEAQMREMIARTEREHIRLVPEGEREEVRQIFERKGFTGHDLDRAVEIITSDTTRWVETMLREEFGLEEKPVSPWMAACVTFVSFMIAGCLPLAAYVFEFFAPGKIEPFGWSVALSIAAFFATGAVKGRSVGQWWLISALETTAVGAVSSGISFFLGVALKRFAGS